MSREGVIGWGWRSGQESDYPRLCGPRKNLGLYSKSHKDYEQSLWDKACAPTFLFKKKISLQLMSGEWTVGSRRRSKKEHFGSCPRGGGQACAPEVVVGKKAEEKI